MTKKRFIVELGTGMDLHGMDPTKAACRAVRDAIGHNCLCGVVEICGCSDLDTVEVEVNIACPNPEQVDADKVLAVLPVGQKRIHVEKGGMLTEGLCIEQFAEACSTILVANAAITVWVDGRTATA